MEKTKITIKRTEFYEDEKLVRVEEETVEEREETPDPKPYQWPTQPHVTWGGDIKPLGDYGFKGHSD